MRQVLIVTVLVTLFLSAAHSVSAQALVVNSLDDGATTCEDGYCTLRGALAAAQDGDTITFDVTGVIHLHEPLHLITSGVLRIAGPGADTLTLSGDSRAPVLIVGSYTTLILGGVTIAQGQGSTAFPAGGINNAGSLRLTDSVVRDNTAAPEVLTAAGGIFSSGPLIIERSVIDANHAAAGIGGVLGSGPLLSITGSRITANTGNQVGGLYAFGAQLRLIDSVVQGNQGREVGGVLNSADGAISGSQILDNSANGDGPNSIGGIGNDAGATLRIQTSQITGNVAGGSADLAAGGIFNYGGATLSIYYTQITGNSVTTGSVQASGLYNAADATLLDSDIQGVGCGIVNDTGVVTLTDSRAGQQLVLPMNTCAVRLAAPLLQPVQTFAIVSLD